MTGKDKKIETLQEMVRRLKNENNKLRRDNERLNMINDEQLEIIQYRLKEREENG
jgi:uncharacterized membrane protein (DUF106 family)